MTGTRKTEVVGKLKSAVLGLPKRFARDEKGTMIAFGLFVFVIMLMAGGAAVDFMRFEHERAKVQYTLDRSILAAAALQQPLEPQDVVADYFEKSDLDDYNLSVGDSSGLNFRTVTANANTDMRTYFINMLGIKEMKASARGGAEERIQKVEISLVLDVSGSMGNNSKLENLKDAARDFVDEILTEQNQDLVSISLIPYNMQVNAGADILDELNVTSEHAYSNCIDFDENDFASTAIGSSQTLQRTGHFNPFYYQWSNHPNDPTDRSDQELFMCPTSTFSEMMVFSQDKAALKAKINSLQAGGNTSIDIGVRWGTALLDSSMQHVVEDQSNVPAVFQDRPRPYSDDDVLKVLVVMTDGVNTTQYTLDEDFASGDSNVWYDPDSTWLSTMYDVDNAGDSNGDGIPNSADFYNSDLYHWDLDNDGRDDDEFTDEPYDEGNNSAQRSNAYRLTWPELWNIVGTRYNAYYHHYSRTWQANSYYTWRDSVVDVVYDSDKDDRLHDACTAAKDNEMVVFTIGFEVPNTQDLIMSNCATSASHYFSVEGDEISNAFNAIAKTIQRLKLTH